MSMGKNTHPFYKKLEQKIQELGGMHNAHLHLDRAGTLDDQYMQASHHRILESSHISLQKKHSLINVLHASSAYEKHDLSARVNSYIDVMIECNTAHADTLVDVTADRVGTSALETLLEIKASRSEQINLSVGAYSPLGFKDSEPERWDLLEKGVQFSDFIAALPEADDTDDYPDHIGFMKHCNLMLQLAKDKNCIIHVHTDQRNEPSENGTERLVEAVAKYGSPIIKDKGPSVWAVHAISPSTYDELRFQNLIEGMAEANIGVICCPSAALGMRQLRPISTPTYNSIPRILEFLAAGIHVRLASDNIADILSPTTTANLIDEVFILSAAIRFYNADILAKLACGHALDSSDIDFIKDHLSSNDIEIAQVLNGEH